MQDIIDCIMPSVTNPERHPSHGITEKDSDIGTAVELVVNRIRLAEITTVWTELKGAIVFFKTAKKLEEFDSTMQGQWGCLASFGEILILIFSIEDFIPRSEYDVLEIIFL